MKYGKNQSKVECEQGKYPIYGTGGVIGHSNTSLYNKPTILIGRKGSIESITFVEEPFWAVDTTFYTIINETIVDPFYLYCILSLIDLKQFDEGTTIPSLRAETLYNIELELPNLEIQHKIVSIIRSYDFKIQLNQRINDKELVKNKI